MLKCNNCSKEISDWLRFHRDEEGLPYCSATCLIHRKPKLPKCSFCDREIKSKVYPALVGIGTAEDELKYCSVLCLLADEDNR